MLMQSLLRVDRHLYIRVAGHPRACQRAQIARWISRTGDGPCYVLLALLVGWLTEQQGRAFVITSLCAFAVELPSYLLLKHSCRRHRPEVWCEQWPAFIRPSDRFSLPSGHTAAGFVVATLLCHFFPLRGGLALLWAVAIGVSRVVLRVHYPSDVVCGALLGICASQLALLIS